MGKLRNLVVATLVGISTLEVYINEACAQRSEGDKSGLFPFIGFSVYDIRYNDNTFDLEVDISLMEFLKEQESEYKSCKISQKQEVTHTKMSAGPNAFAGVGLRAGITDLMLGYSVYPAVTINEVHRFIYDADNCKGLWASYFSLKNTFIEHGPYFEAKVELGHIYEGHFLALMNISHSWREVVLRKDDESKTEEREESEINAGVLATDKISLGVGMQRKHSELILRGGYHAMNVRKQSSSKCKILPEEEGFFLNLTWRINFSFYQDKPRSYPNVGY